MTRVRTEIVRLSRYGAVGIVTNVSLYLAFLILFYAGTPAVAASAICYVAGVTLNYLLNRRWTFQSQADHRRDMLKFLLAYGIGFGVTMICMTYLTRWTAAELAQILTIGITAITIYLSLRLFQFGQ